MKNENPFDPNMSPDKHQFFMEMSEALNTWMIKKYPTLCTDIEARMNSINLEHIKIRGIQQNIENMQASLDSAFKDAYRQCKNDFDKKTKEYLGIDLTKKIKDAHKLIEKSLNDLHKKTESFKEFLDATKKSKSLLTTIFTLRDDVDTINKKFNDFYLRMQEIFKKI